ncbi:MAG TPA: zinc-binding dehydrogenase [Dehalococcoidia bacterium]|nr:zinc-binding dehydrogenase [Dehalococcoidia bacterium]
MLGLVRASVQTGPRRHEVREFPRPQIGLDDGLLRVEACGICGSDIEQFEDESGRRPHDVIPGHEPLGIIEEVGERAAQRWGVKPGDRVALESYLPCAKCDQCLAGNYMSCRSGRFYYGFAPVSEAPSLWGGYAEYIYLHPNAIMHKVRNDLPADVAVMYNPLGAGVRWACHLGGVGPGQSLLVLGPGQRGLAAVIAAKAAGASTVIVTGLERDAAKPQLAREFGADYTINVDKEDTVARVKAITDGKLVDVVLDVTPLATQPILDAMECVRHSGRVVLAGLKGRRQMQFSPDSIIQKGATVIGAFGVDSRAYKEAIEIIESGRFPLEKLHTHTLGLEDTAHAIEMLAGKVPGEAPVHMTIRPDLQGSGERQRS